MNDDVDYEQIRVVIQDTLGAIHNKLYFRESDLRHEKEDIADSLRKGAVERRMSGIGEARRVVGDVLETVKATGITTCCGERPLVEGCFSTHSTCPECGESDPETEKRSDKEIVEEVISEIEELRPEDEGDGYLKDVFETPSEMHDDMVDSADTEGD